LFVSPTGESLLFDTGNPGNGDRDAKRIFATAKKAGLTRIDHVVISHWHGDHVGGLEALSKMIPLGKFYDHGDGVEAADKARHDTYVSIAGKNRKILRAGDMIALGPVQFRVMVSEGPVISNPINGGGANALCTNAPQMSPAAPENIRMVSLAANYGSSNMPASRISIGRAKWSWLVRTNKLGHVNLYTINRHGGLDDSGAPALLGAVKPQVVVFNNGPRKGLGTEGRTRRADQCRLRLRPYEKNSYLRIVKTPAMKGVWQLHRSMLDPDPAHNTSPI
jgi:hypothetical protein